MGECDAIPARPVIPRAGIAAVPPASRLSVAGALCCSLVAAVLLLAAASVAIGSDGTTPTDLGRLMRQLGATEFSERQAAEIRLRTIGPPALESLRRALQAGDPEVSARSAQLLRQVQDLHYEQLLEPFIAMAPGGEAVDLPGWRALRQITGDDPVARRFYADMLRREPELLLLLSERSPELRAAVEVRLVAVEMLRREGSSIQEARVKPDELAVLLLVAVSQPPGLGLQLPEYVLDSPPLPPHNEVQERAEWEPLRRLLGAWVLTPHAGRRNLRFEVGQRYRLPEVLETAREVVADSAASVRERHDAIVVIARHGGVQHIPDLEPLLSARESLQSRTVRTSTTFECRLQDVALAALLHLTSQEPADYGLKRPRDRDFVVDSQTIGFATEDERRTALRRWRTWRAVKLQSPLFGPLDAISGTTL